MAVDFSLLPTEQSVSSHPPSPLIWIAVFFVLLLITIFAVLLLWPKNMSMHTWRFWLALTIFPTGIGSFVVLRRYSVYEGRKLDIELSNEAIREYNERIFEVASIPLALVGAAYRFSADTGQNAIEGIRAGVLKLETQEALALDGEPAKRRWLTVPEMDHLPSGKVDDSSRHRQLIRWLFSELLGELAVSIQALPGRLNLHVHFAISSGLTHQESEALWQRCWHERQLRHASMIEIATQAVDLGTLDVWLDRVIETSCNEARLIVAIQLHPLFSALPPAGVAEAGVALLLVPDALASRLKVDRMANLHRSVRGPFERSSDAVSHAMKWAKVAARDIHGGWKTGVNATQYGLLRKSAAQLSLDIHPTDLDQSVGYTGVAAPWLAIACAAGSLSVKIQTQLILAGQAEIFDCAVLLGIPVRKPVLD